MKILQFLILLTVVGGIVAIILLLAELGSDTPCKFDDVILGTSCILRSQKELSGALLGALGTILAGWLAWVGIQQQIRQQQRSTVIGELTFWQNQADNAELGLSGLEIIEPIVSQCIDVLRREDETAYPYVHKLRVLQQTGVLDHSHYPATGPEQTSWKLNTELTRLRVAFLELRRHNFNVGNMREYDSNARAAFEKVRVLHEEIPNLKAKRRAEIQRSRMAIEGLEQAL